MFIEITWATYLRCTAAALFIYYSLLLLKFYYPQLKSPFAQADAGYRMLQTKDITQDEGSSILTEGNGNLTPKGSFTEPGPNDHEIIEELVERIREALQDADAANAQDSELTGKLKGIVNDYPFLARSAFRPSINEFIATESQQHGFSAITMAAVDELWQTL